MCECHYSWTLVMGLEMLVGILTIGMSVGMKTRMGGGMGGVNMALAKKGL